MNPRKRSRGVGYKKGGSRHQRPSNLNIQNNEIGIRSNPQDESAYPAFYEGFVRVKSSVEFPGGLKEYSMVAQPNFYRVERQGRASVVVAVHQGTTSKSSIREKFGSGPVKKRIFRDSTFNSLKNKDEFSSKYSEAMSHIAGQEEKQDEQILATIQKAVEKRKNKS